MGNLLPATLRKSFVSLCLLKSHDTPGSIGKQTLATLLGKSPTILEIGAHHGIDTYELAKTFPSGKVIAFEPWPSSFVKASRYTRRLANVRIIPVALSSSSGFALFHQSSGKSDGSGSILEPTAARTIYPHISWDPENRIIVPTATLDEYATQSRISCVDLIWIDAQGAEGHIFKGGHNTLLSTRFIYCEVSGTPEYAGAPTYSEIKELLGDYGFRVTREFLPPSWNGSGNVLFHKQ